MLEGISVRGQHLECEDVPMVEEHHDHGSCLWDLQLSRDVSCVLTVIGKLPPCKYLSLKKCLLNELCM